MGLKSGEGFIDSLIGALSTDTMTIAGKIAGTQLRRLDSTIEKTSKKAAKDGSEKLAERLAKAQTERKGWENIQQSIQKGAEELTDEQVEFLKSGDGGGLLNIPRAAKEYMMEDGKKKYRWGAYGAAMVGGRLISGGTPIHNNTGERDIAGIPFI